MIYTLTFQNVLNYGAVLQAYALQKFIAKAGYRTSIVDYRPSYFSWQIYRPAKGFAKTARKYKRILLFRDFRKKYLEITHSIVRNVNDLRILPEARAFVCGSDQIWNDKITGGNVDSVFTLAVDSPGRKIAYAASAGGHRISKQGDAVLKRIVDFHSIGTREDYLADDIKTFNKTSLIEHVVDPTLLIEDYDDLLADGNHPTGRYIASYEVSEDASREKFDIAVRRLKELTGLPVYHLGAKPIPSADHTLDVISPCDWLSTLYNATLVCTNSFHGTAFSLNFGKPFLTVSHIEAEKNARVISLLGRSKLKGRYCLDAEGISLDEVLAAYDKSSLRSFIQSSQQFLLSSLSDSAFRADLIDAATPAVVTP